MKTTLIVTHVMPQEIEMFERFMVYYKNTFKYLDGNDRVNLFVTLNLNPKLTDWDNSELKQQYFINKFNFIMKDTMAYQNIIVDESLWGTTQQKRNLIKTSYDQFIFVDCDIAVPEQLLKLQLEASYKVNGAYVISPNIPKWWDKSWDVLVHKKYQGVDEIDKQEIWDSTFTQDIESIDMRKLPMFKFGCGMHTLYSKEFWDMIGIPEEFGGYGSEDTFAMFAAAALRENGYNIQQYLLDGIYISEDWVNRKPTFDGKVKSFDTKDKFSKNSGKILAGLINKFKSEISKS